MNDNTVKVDLYLQRSEKFGRAHHSDVLVIGGGVNGLAVAWSAALSGLSVTVIDKGDWGSGTSSWSSRLIHGGLKYLQKLDVALVRESLADREWLLQAAPHLVKPMPFLLPYLRGAEVPRSLLRAGMLTYDLLSLDKSVPWHKHYSRKQALETWPGIRSEGLLGGSVYFDAQVENSERLCVELMVAAREAGANTINYARVENLLIESGAVVGALVVDEHLGGHYEMRATQTVNLAGAWLDSVFAGTELGSRRWIGGTKGTHLVVRKPDFPIPTSVYFESDDARPMMVLPWKDMMMIGSTDKRFEGDIDTMSADQEEIDYILYETNKMFPAWGVSEDDVHYWYTGLRPLPYVSAEKTADISRRHTVHTHKGIVSGLVSVTGGKLTTFRSLSGHVMKEVSRRLKMKAVRIDTQIFPGATSMPTQALDDTKSSNQRDRIYGARAVQLEALVEQHPELSRVIDDSTGLTASEVVHAVAQEEAVTLADVVARRITDGLNADLGDSGLDAISREMAGLLGWSEKKRKAQIADYRNYTKRFRVKAPVGP